MTELEKIIRPIVEGQIRGFIKEHPSILKGVDWYRVKGRDPAQSLIGSLSKRIVRDLTCGINSARLAATFLASRTGTMPMSSVEPCTCGDSGAPGRLNGRAALPNEQSE
jgi:hypothetical protein